MMAGETDEMLPEGDPPQPRETPTVDLEQLERWWEAASEDPDIIFAQEHGDDALNFKQ